MPKRSEAEISKSIDKLRKNYAHLLTGVIIGPRSTRSPLPERMLELGRNIRENYTKYPILPGAIHTYIDLASTREWIVTGQPRAAARAWDWVNNAETVNPYTGMVDYGFDSYLRRRVLDYLCIGATTFACNFDPESPLEYIDPTRLRFIHQPRFDPQTNEVLRIRPEDLTWQHRNNRLFRAGELWVHYPIPVGDDGFMSPLMHLLPTATLAWLIRESDTATVDGRRIRDIIFVNNPTLADVIEEAILTQLALWSGANPEDVGIPIVPIQGGTGPVKDMFARLGLSEIPTTLDREKFEFSFVNEISGAIGLALRHFWNNERTTNRALEVVQEQRQQQKGPASFVRSEQRLLNRSGLFKRFGGSVKLPTRFSFIEETDASSLKERAEVLKLHAEAFGLFMDRLGLAVSTESLVAWMQSEGTLPYELEFLEVAKAPAGAAKPSDPSPSGNIEAGAISSDPQPTTMEQQEKSMGAGEIMINQNGDVLATRRKGFSLNMVLEKILKPVEDELANLARMSDEDYLKQLEIEAAENSRLQFLQILEYDAVSLDKWIDMEPDLFNNLSYKIHNQIYPLTELENHLLLRVISDPDADR